MSRPIWARLEDDAAKLRGVADSLEYRAFELRCPEVEPDDLPESDARQCTGDREHAGECRFVLRDMPLERQARDLGATGNAWEKS